MRFLAVAALGVGLVVGAAALPIGNRLAAKVSVGGPLDGTKIVSIPAFGQASEQKAQFFSSDVPAPLIVDLHQWGGNHKGHSGSYQRLDEAVKAKGWNFIRPDVVDLATVCDPAKVVDGIRASIAYAKRHGKVSTVHILGSSGGGYMALAAWTASVPADSYQAWVPISDLAAWERQQRNSRFGASVRTCAGANAPAWSPINRPLPAYRSPLNLYAGADDGAGFPPGSDGKRFIGVVPPSHAMRFFNRLTSTPISDAEILRVMENRDGDGSGRIGDRKVILQRESGPYTITIFDGAHEMLADVAVRDVVRK